MGEPDPPDPGPADRSVDHRFLTRRGALALAGGGVAAAGLAGAGWLLARSDQTGEPSHRPTGRMIGPHDRRVRETERRRHPSGRVKELTLTANPGTVDLAGRTVDTWLYGGQLAGPVVRLGAGDRLRARLDNQLPEATTVHWHGLALRNDMDGVPGLTMEPVASGKSFDYDFTVPDPGTYWLHSHVEMQRDRGLYAPLIVDDPHELGDYDQDFTAILDDWADGVLGTPDAILHQLSTGTKGSMLKPAIDGASPWGPMLGDVAYPLHLVNGRPPADPATFRARPGQRIRLRLINAAADTVYRVALGGHRLTVTHADGWPITPVTVDTLLIGMGERYDVLVTAGDGAFPLVASAEGRNFRARTILRTGSGAATPDIGARPTELGRRLLSYRDLRPGRDTALPHRTPDRTARLLLSQDPTRHRWLINHKAAPHGHPVVAHPGERLRLEFVNSSAMAHPMHLHGHTFALTGEDSGGADVRKDTVVVLPGKTVAITVQADNPGQWLLHCHNAYHMAQGMSTVLSYQEN